MAFPDVDVSVVFDGLLHLIHMAIRIINDLPAPMSSSVSCSFYADDLTIWSFFVSVPTAAEATQGALIRLERCSAYWHVPLNLSKCEASLFSVNPHQANLQSNLLLFNFRLRFSLTSTFLGVTFNRILSFSKRVSSLKAKFFARLKALRCISASSWGPSEDSLSLPFVQSLSSAHSHLCFTRLFFFLSFTNITKLERHHRAVSLVISGCLSSSSIPFFLSEATIPPLRVTLTHFALSFYERTLRSQPPFSFQV